MITKAKLENYKEDKSRISMIEENFHIYSIDELKEVSFTLFPKQKQICEMLGRENNVYIKKCRHVGVSSVISAYLACEAILEKKNIVILSSDVDIAICNVLDRIEQHLVDVKQIEHINKNKIILTNGSVIYAGDDYSIVENMDCQPDIIYIDEAAFMENIDDVLEKNNNSNIRFIVASTPNYQNTSFDKIFKENKKNAEVNNTIEISWYQEPRHNRNLEWKKVNPKNSSPDIIKEDTLNERGDIHYDEKRWVRLMSEGYMPTSPFYKKLCDKFDNNPETIKQQLLGVFVDEQTRYILP